VLIPQANVEHLMLRSDVVEAVEQGQFAVYPVETVDEALELLTGVEAGERDEEGNFPAGSVNQRVEARLIELAEKQRAFADDEESETAPETSSEEANDGKE
jgi:predicted ATP-dependent protease